MKKLLSIIAAVVLIALFAVGCTGQPEQVPQQSEGQTQPQNTQPTNQNTPDTGTAQSSAENPPQTAPQNPVDSSNFIGEERAKEIALQRAGLTAADVVFDRVELDRDDGVWLYEIDFRQGRTEYDVDIKADDGTVIAFETDYDD